MTAVGVIIGTVALLSIFRELEWPAPNETTGKKIDELLPELGP